MKMHFAITSSLLYVFGIANAINHIDDDPVSFNQMKVKSKRSLPYPYNLPIEPMQSEYAFDRAPDSHVDAYPRFIYVVDRPDTVYRTVMQRAAAAAAAASSADVQPDAFIQLTDNIVYIPQSGYRTSDVSKPHEIPAFEESTRPDREEHSPVVIILAPTPKSPVEETSAKYSPAVNVRFDGFRRTNPWYDSPAPTTAVPSQFTDPIAYETDNSLVTSLKRIAMKIEAGMEMVSNMPMLVEDDTEDLTSADDDDDEAEELDEAEWNKILNPPPTTTMASSAEEEEEDDDEWTIPTTESEPITTTSMPVEEEKKVIIDWVIEPMSTTISSVEDSNDIDRYTVEYEPISTVADKSFEED